MTRHSYAGGANTIKLTTSLDEVTRFAPTTAMFNWPDFSIGPFIVTINRGKPNEEKCLVAEYATNLLTFAQRGYDGTVATAHSADEPVEHTIGAWDVDTANQHGNAVSGAHGLPSGDDFVGTTAFYAEVAARVAADANIVPVGAVLAYAGSVLPANWLLCDGSVIDAGAYPLLKALMPNTPDLRGAFIMGGSTAVPATRGGADTVTLAAGNMPIHSHAVGATSAGTPQIDAVGNHNHGGGTGNQSANHDHGINISAVGDHSHGATYLANGSAAGGNSFVRTHGSSGSVGGTVGAPAGGHSHGASSNAETQAHAHGINGDGTHGHTATALPAHGHTLDSFGSATPTAVSTVSVHVVLAYMIRAA